MPAGTCSISGAGSSSSVTTPSSMVKDRTDGGSSAVETSSQCGKPAVADQRTSVRLG